MVYPFWRIASAALKADKPTELALYGRLTAKKL
jgi:hypothetical protein